jgi:hypothetical protein
LHVFLHPYLNGQHLGTIRQFHAQKELFLRPFSSSLPPLFHPGRVGIRFHLVEKVKRNHIDE